MECFTGRNCVPYGNTDYAYKKNDELSLATKTTFDYFIGTLIKCAVIQICIPRYLAHLVFWTQLENLGFSQRAQGHLWA